MAAARRPAGATGSATAGGLGPAVWAALGVVYLVWGSTYLAIRFAIETLPPLLQGGLRFVVAGVLLLAAVVALRGRRVLRASPGQLATAAASGVLLLTGGNGLVSIGEQRVPSAVAALIIASVPLWIVVLRALLRDRPAWTTALGVLVGFAGVALLLRPGGGAGLDLRYAGLIVVAAFCWSVGALLVTRRPVPADPVVLSAVQMLAGGATMLVLSVGRGELSGFTLAAVSAKSWLAVAYLVGFGSLGFVAFTWLLGNAPVSVVSTYAYVNPAVAVLLGVLLAGERLTGSAVAGGLLILVAVALVVTTESRARRRARQAVPSGEPPADHLAA